MLPCFGMIWNCHKFSKWNTKSSIICTLSKKNIYSNLVVKNHMTYCGNYKYNKKKVSKYFI